MLLIFKFERYYSIFFNGTSDIYFYYGKGHLKMQRGNPNAILLLLPYPRQYDATLYLAAMHVLYLVKSVNF